MSKEKKIYFSLLISLLFVLMVCIGVGSSLLGEPQVAYAYNSSSVVTVWFDADGSGTINGSETEAEYTDFYEAWTAALTYDTTDSNKVTIKLLQDTTAVRTVMQEYISNPVDYVVLNTNKKTLTLGSWLYNSYTRNAYLGSDKSIEIMGGGTIKGAGMQVLRLDGTSSIKDVKIESTSTTPGESTTVQIEGTSTIENCQIINIAAKGVALKIKGNSQSVTIKSGSITAKGKAISIIEGTRAYKDRNIVDFSVEKNNTIDITLTDDASESDSAFIATGTSHFGNVNFSGEGNVNFVTHANADAFSPSYSAFNIISSDCAVNFNKGNILFDITDSKFSNIFNTNLPNIASGVGGTIKSGSSSSDLTNKSSIAEIGTDKYATISLKYIGDIALTYNANGGTVSPSSKSVTYGSTNVQLAIPIKSMCVFDGWYSAAGGTGTKITGADGILSVMNYEEATTLYAKWVEVGTIFEAKFYRPQVWDCQRSPAFPIVNRTMKISGLKTAYNKNLATVQWAAGDYVQFAIVYDSVSSILDNEVKERIITSLMSYTGCTREEIEAAVVVSETLYNSAGVKKAELSDIGLVWALGDEGFLYTALNGSKATSGGVGTFVSFVGHKLGDTVIYETDKKTPYTKDEINAKTDVITDGDSNTPSDNTLYFGGTVVNTNGEVLSGITVNLTYNETQYSFTTDSKGIFLSDSIVQVSGVTAYTVVLTDGTHGTVTYSKDFATENGFGNDNSEYSATDIYVYTYPADRKSVV